MWRPLVITAVVACVVISSDAQNVDCHSNSDSGHCYASFRKYFYDQNSGQCKEFIYGGCGGNSNRYSTKEECLRTCGGARKRRATAVEQNCVDPPLVGRCKALMYMFSYDQASGKCVEFTYGGCGNGNAYATEQECLKACAN